MESKQRKTSYDATFKRKVIVYAEKYGNRKKTPLWITVMIAVENMMSIAYNHCIKLCLFVLPVIFLMFACTALISCCPSRDSH